MSEENSSLLDSCSPTVRSGLEFLEMRLSQHESYVILDGLAFYLLNRVGSDLVSDFIEDTKSEEFWNGDISEYYQELYHICLLYSDLGLDWRENKNLVSSFEEAAIVTQEGELLFGMHPHGSALRPLSLIFPEDERTQLALSYFESHFKELDRPDMALGLLAIAEYHSSQYQHTLNTGLEILEKEFEDEIGFSGDTYDSLERSVLGLLVLVRLSDRFESERAAEWLKERQQENGSWGSSERTEISVTTLSLLVLFAVGEGPKAPRNPIEWESKRLREPRTDVPATSGSENQNLQESDSLIENFRRLSPGLVVVESMIIIYLIWSYNPAILDHFIGRSKTIIPVIAAVLTILLKGPEAYRRVRERF